MLKSARTRILVASGLRARWVERARGLDDLVTIGELTPVFAHAPSGPPPTSFGQIAGQHRGSGDRGEAKRRRDDFAAQIAEALNRQEAKGEFDRLGLVAPTRLLKAIRDHLSVGARAKLHFEVPKDLSKHANHDLRAWLQNPEFA